MGGPTLRVSTKCLAVSSHPLVASLCCRSTPFTTFGSASSRGGSSLTLTRRTLSRQAAAAAAAAMAAVAAVAAAVGVTGAAAAAAASSGGSSCLGMLRCTSTHIPQPPAAHSACLPPPLPLPRARCRPRGATTGGGLSGSTRSCGKLARRRSLSASASLWRRRRGRTRGGWVGWAQRSCCGEAPN